MVTVNAEVSGGDLNRLEISWVSAAEGAKWVKIITEFTEGWVGPPTPAMTRARERGKRYLPRLAAIGEDA